MTETLRSVYFFIHVRFKAINEEVCKINENSWWDTLMPVWTEGLRAKVATIGIYEV